MMRNVFSGERLAMRRKNDAVLHRGHLLASTLFGGHRRNEPEPRHGSLLRNQRNNKCCDSAKPKSIGATEYGDK